MKYTRLKILLILFMSTVVNLHCCALTTNENLNLIENHIFGYENSKLNTTERLNKIEKFVYGASQNTSTQERLNSLNSDLGIELKTNNNLAQNLPTAQYPQEIDYSNEPTDPTAQYPIVDNIETALLNKTYKTENIYKRLDRLEQKAYGKISKGSLSERVEKLSALAPPPIQKNNSYDEYMANNDDYNYFSPATNGNPRASSAPVHIPETIPSPSNSNNLLALEQSILGKTYSTESTDNRLSRLEKKLLNKEFSTEPDEFRIERLSTVANAQQSAQVYKENKLMQHLSTGIQIGGMILMLLAMIL